MRHYAKTNTLKKKYNKKNKKIKTRRKTRRKRQIGGLTEAEQAEIRNEFEAELGLIREELNQCHQTIEHLGNDNQGKQRIIDSLQRQLFKFNPLRWARQQKMQKS